jgi:DNA-binding NtrC family response regulator
MHRPTLLVVDDVPEAAAVTTGILEKQGWETTTAQNGNGMLQVLASQFVDLLILDQRLEASGETGTELMDKVRSAYPGIPGLILTAYANLNLAVKAMRSGIVDLVEKQDAAKDPAVLTRAVSRALATSTASRDARRRRWEASTAAVLPGMVGSSEAMKALATTVRKFARLNQAVLILGESGTGKELVARALHLLSQRPGPFFEVNVSAIPQHLFESEMFGSKKGGFTDAKRDRGGHFQAARGGTLFLDEIGDASLEAQAKLLKAIEEGEVIPVGGRPEKVDVRIIAATHKDLAQEVLESRFRLDLYHRIEGFRVVVPALRERPADIRLLAQYFLDRHCSQHHLGSKTLSKGAIRRLEAHRWPGNVREIDKVILKAAVLVDESDIPEGAIEIAGSIPGGPERTADDLEYLFAMPQKEAVREFKRRQFQWAKRKTGGNKTKAADLLQTGRSTLYLNDCKPHDH